MVIKRTLHFRLEVGTTFSDPKDSHATILVESESSVKERADEEPKPPKQKTFLLCHEESQLTSERIKVNFHIRLASTGKITTLF